MKKYIIGIDPGQNGGITSILNNRIVSIDALTSNRDDMFELFKCVIGYGLKTYDTFIFIENVHSMPRMNSKSVFTFGRNLGTIEGIISSFNIPEERLLYVTPQKWMKHFELKRTPEESQYQYKQRLLLEARKQASTAFSKEIDIKTCDSVLIALYGAYMQK